MTLLRSFYSPCFSFGFNYIGFLAFIQTYQVCYCLRFLFMLFLCLEYCAWLKLCHFLQLFSQISMRHILTTIFNSASSSPLTILKPNASIGLLSLETDCSCNQVGFFAVSASLGNWFPFLSLG